MAFYYHAWLSKFHITTPPHPLQFSSSRPQFINFHYALLSLFILFPQPEKCPLTFSPNQIIVLQEVLLPSLFWPSSHHRVVCSQNPDSRSVWRIVPAFLNFSFTPLGDVPFPQTFFLILSFPPGLLTINPNPNTITRNTIQVLTGL